MSTFRSAARASSAVAAAWSTLRVAVDAEALRRASAGQPGPPGPLHVLDVGGGSGGLAVPLALLGHDVTVVDPSPDSLAALERRADEAGVGARVVGHQGDTDQLPALVGERRFDVVVCHSVLELVDDPDATLGQLAAVLAPDGLLSLLVPNRTAAVLTLAVAGRFSEAAALLDSPHGRWGAGDSLPRRFSVEEVVRLVERAKFRVESLHGVRVLADLVPSGAAEADPLASAALARLEERLTDRAEFLSVAGRLHVLARASPADRPGAP